MCLCFCPMKACSEDRFSSGARPTGHACGGTNQRLLLQECPRCPVIQMACCWAVQGLISQEWAQNYLIVTWYGVKKAVIFLKLQHVLYFPSFTAFCLLFPSLGPRMLFKISLNSLVFSLSPLQLVTPLN